MVAPLATALARFDFRRGVNSVASPEILGPQELRLARNLVGYEYGGLTTRAGSQRVHTSALAGAVTGFHRWFVSGAWQTVVVAGGNFYKKADADADFTLVASGFSTSTPTRFRPWRTGASVVLLLTDGTLRQWNGTTLSTIAGAPACTLLRPYKGRLYVAGDPANPKRFYGSGLNDFTNWNTALGAVLGDAEQFDQEPISGLATTGSSMLIFKEDAIQRWSGVTSLDFDLGRDSEGVSRRVGCVAPDTLVEVEGIVYFLSDLGVWVASEGGVQPISEQIADVWFNARKDLWSKAVACWNPMWKEYRIFLPVGTDGGNFTGWYYNAILNCWHGPHVLRNNGGTGNLQLTAMGEYELSTGETMGAFGGADGFLRVMDTMDLDDVLRSGVGGAGIPWDVNFGDIVAGDLRRQKSFDDLQLSMDLPLGQQATIYWQEDEGTEQSVTLNGKGAGVQSYEVGQLGAVAKRLKLGVRGSATQPARFAGFQLEAQVMP